MWIDISNISSCISFIKNTFTSWCKVFVGLYSTLSYKIGLRNVKIFNLPFIHHVWHTKRLFTTTVYLKHMQAVVCLFVICPYSLFVTSLPWGIWLVTPGPETQPWNIWVVSTSLTLNVRGPTWLLMLWLLTSPGWCRIGRFLSYLRKDFNYMRRINVEIWHKMKIYVYVLSEKFRTYRVYTTIMHNEARSLYLTIIFLNVYVQFSIGVSTNNVCVCSYAHVGYRVFAILLGLMQGHPVDIYFIKFDGA